MATDMMKAVIAEDGQPLTLGNFEKPALNLSLIHI